MEVRPLILTARFDPILFETLDQLRRQYFPPARNFISAHVTLFHDLPGLQLDAICAVLQAGPHVESVACRLPSIKFTGRGMHAVLQCDQLCEIRARLVNRWRELLSKQDAQLFRPHVTIQNKADPAVARRAVDELSQRWDTLEGRIIGLDLWHYAGGPWEAAASFSLPTA